MRDTLMRVREHPGPSSEEEVLPDWLIAGGSGVGAAVVSATMVVVLAVLGWLTGAGGSESAGTTVSAGLAAWCFSHGAPLALDKGSVGLIPWLLTGWPLLCAWFSAQRVVPSRTTRSPRMRGFGGVRRDVVATMASFVAGYVLTGVVIGFGAHLGGARPSFAATILGAFVVSVLAFGLALRPGFHGHLGDLAPRVEWARREYVPTWVGHAIRPAAGAVIATLVSGALLVVVAIALSAWQVGEVYARLGGGIVGGTLLTLIQLGYLPTLAVWGASWLAGPGFGLGGDTAVTWSHSGPGVIPMVPVLAAVPPPGPMPGWTPAGIAVPLLIGVLLGWSCARHSERTWAARMRVTGVAIALYALAMLVISVAASGPVGAGRFAHVGVDPVLTALALTGEVGGVALLVASVTGVRLARRREAPSRDEARAEGRASTRPDVDDPSATPDGTRGTRRRTEVVETPPRRTARAGERDDAPRSPGADGRDGGSRRRVDAAGPDRSPTRRPRNGVAGRPGPDVDAARRGEGAPPRETTGGGGRPRRSSGADRREESASPGTDRGAGGRPRRDGEAARRDEPTRSRASSGGARRPRAAADAVRRDEGAPSEGNGTGGAVRGRREERGERIDERPPPRTAEGEARRRRRPSAEEPRDADVTGNGRELGRDASASDRALRRRGRSPRRDR